jgi:arylsulfatase A-like enzyme
MDSRHGEKDNAVVFAGSREMSRYGVRRVRRWTAAFWEDDRTIMKAPRSALPRALACLLALAAMADGADTPPNVVLIISDDHGWTDYGFMGHSAVRTPNLDKLAAQGLLFPRGYVPSSVCCPSLASIVTGLYPHQHRITSNDPPGPRDATSFREGREAMNRHLEAVPTLPRLLAQKGSLSLQTGKWWQGDYRRGGFTHGMTRGERHGDAGLTIGRETLRPIEDFVGEARRQGKPFFIWYAPMMPHSPHNPPERLIEKYKASAPTLHVARYWAMVEWFDETCGDLMKCLEANSVADDTIVVYVADNGWIQDPEQANRPLRSKLTPYDAGLRTPIIVSWPGHVKPGRSDAAVMSLDILPTLLAAAGIARPADASGIDLLDPAAVAARASVFGECFVHTARSLDVPAENLEWRWVIHGAWKLIAPDPVNRKGEKPELYDLAADPGEKNNLAAKMQEQVDALMGRLDAWWQPRLTRQ